MESHYATTFPTVTAQGPLAAKLNDAWYEAIEGVYSGNVPTWGPETEMVNTLIGCSCAEGDIVSWDTRSADPGKHLFLRRRWNPAHQSSQPEHDFSIYTGAELAEVFADRDRLRVPEEREI